MAELIENAARESSPTHELRIHNLLAGRINHAGKVSIAKRDESTKTELTQPPSRATSSLDLTKGNDSIKVGVRVRPLTPRERETRSRHGLAHFRHKKPDPSDASAWSLIGKETIVQKGARRVEGRSLFQFDSIFPESTKTHQVYEEMVRPIVHGAMKGQNGTVFCYGQTSSGKTFTMQGDEDAGNDGLVQLAAADLFKSIEKASKKRDCVVKVSYIEIHNEKVRDLLDNLDDEAKQSMDSSPKSKDSSPKSKDSSPKFKRNNSSRRGKLAEFTANLRTLTVREDSKRGGVFVNGKEKKVKDATALVDVLKAGNQNRSVASTSMNDRSSRSHTIFRISLESREKVKSTSELGDEGCVLRVSNLNLVDLAGSENGHQSSTGIRQREGGKINQSLLSLSQVIQALSLPPEKRPAYINYRDSKLTRILQPYLSGNALMAILCCVTPCRMYVEETRSTLKFATRAKLVETKPVVNEVMDDAALIKKLQHELNKARKQVKHLEERERQAEENTAAAKEETNKLKSLVFGDGELPQFEAAHPHNALLARTSPEDNPGASPRHMPPSEVIIMIEPTEKPPAMDGDTDDSGRSQLRDAELRVEFLKTKLDATEDLVESLFKDVESARGCIHTLVFKNVALANENESLKQQLQSCRCNEPQPPTPTPIPNADVPIEPEKEQIKPERDSIQPENELVQPKKESIEPMKESVLPKKESIEPKKESVVLEKGSIEPKKESTAPKNETIKPIKESIEPRKTSTEPKTRPIEPKSRPTEPKSRPTEPKSRPIDREEELTEIRNQSSEESIVC